MRSKPQGASGKAWGAADGHHTVLAEGHSRRAWGQVQAHSGRIARDATFVPKRVPEEDGSHLLEYCRCSLEAAFADPIAVVGERSAAKETTEGAEVRCWVELVGTTLGDFGWGTKKRREGFAPASCSYQR